MSRRILVSFDNTSRTESALRYACSTFPADEIVVLYTIDQRTDETASAGWGSSPDQFKTWVASRREYATEVFERAETVADEYDTTITPVIALGRTHRAIIEEYERRDADFVVLGLRGRSRFQSLLQGDIYERILRAAESFVPMAPVRASWRPPQTVVSTDENREIVVPFDGSKSAKLALEFACSTFSDQSLVATFVDSSPPRVPSRDWDESDTGVDALFEEYHERSEDVLTAATTIASQQGVDLETVPTYGSPDEAILQFVAERDSDLVVVGMGDPPHRRRLLFEPLFEELVHNASAPVLGVGNW
jgi:nucleotide-binding universal stress UspA family protein